MSVGKRDYLSRLQTLLVFLILNGMAKTKLAIVRSRDWEKLYSGTLRHNLPCIECTISDSVIHYISLI